VKRQAKCIGDRAEHRTEQSLATEPNPHSSTGVNQPAAIHAHRQTQAARRFPSSHRFGAASHASAKCSTVLVLILAMMPCQLLTAGNVNGTQENDASLLNNKNTSASGPESPPLDSISNEPVLLGVRINAETSQLSIPSTSPPNALD